MIIKTSTHVLAGLALTALTVGAVVAQSPSINTATFQADGAVHVPQDYRTWVFVGAPLTPNALNVGSAPFPEFHNVYVEPSAFEHWSATGTWADGTQIAKELVTIRTNDTTDPATGASSEVSGVGYFQGDFVGLELTVKDTVRYAEEPGGWAYFSFGHDGEPYAKIAQAFPTDSCNACHEANADTDFVFTQFYPVLSAANPN
ncbi:cytochrome P460 family protein [Rhodobacteraceae bacterium M382]|nr:cytochrome P460 family protein [Rhodobacteraceae bacterium M382]